MPSSEPAAQLFSQLSAALAGRYTVERELGGGGMSRVFVAEETALSRKVVIKVLAPELAAGVSAERFAREIKVAAQLQHPNIVPVLAAGDAAGLPYYVMPFVDGFSLRARLSRSGALPVGEAVAVLRDVTRALANAHAHGVVHRDIKPENILLADESAVVTDFGIAKALHASRTDAPGGTLTQVGTSLGTPAYMAPEQAAGDPDADHRADIYSFGCVAYEVLAGVAPFHDKMPHQLFAAHMTDSAAPLHQRRADVPRSLSDLIARCMEKDPARRPQSAKELLHSLDAVSTPVGHPATIPTKRKLVFAGGIAAVFVFGLVAATMLSRGSASRGRSGPGSLAVLPFENGGDTANAYFADGMAEELGTALAQVPGLRVASRTSSNRFRGASVDLKQVGRDLNVDKVLEGSVRRSGDQLRITASLTNVADGIVLWTNSYSRNSRDVFAVQDDIAKNIASALKTQLATNAGASPATTAAAGTADLAAYDLYLRGRHLWSRRGGASLRRAADLFQQAISRDKNFARAHAGLALVYSVLPQYGERNTDSVVALAIRAGERALTLDSTLSDAHLGLGYAKMYLWKWEESERDFRRALALDPNNAPAHQWYGDFLYVAGRTGEAVEQMKQAFALDPYSPGIANDYSWALFEANRIKEAIEMGQRALEIDSTAMFSQGNLSVYSLYVLPRDSVVAFAREAVRRGQADVTALAHAYTRAGRPEEARAEVTRIKQRAGWPRLGSSIKARLFVVAGMPDSGLFWLQRSINERDGAFFLSSVACSPEFEPVRADPRYIAMLAKIGIRACPLAR